MSVSSSNPSSYIGEYVCVCVCKFTNLLFVIVASIFSSKTDLDLPFPYLSYPGKLNPESMTRKADMRLWVFLQRLSPTPHPCWPSVHCARHQMYHRDPLKEVLLPSWDECREPPLSASSWPPLETDHRLNKGTPFPEKATSVD